MLPNQTISLPPTPFTEAPATTQPLLDFDYDAAMVDIRLRVLQSLSASKMPTNLKQRYIEQEILKQSVAHALSSAAMRRKVVEALLENVEKGPGHLSIHRAKRALKEISARLGPTHPLLPHAGRGRLRSQASSSFARLGQEHKSSESLASGSPRCRREDARGHPFGLEEAICDSLRILFCR